MGDLVDFKRDMIFKKEDVNGVMLLPDKLDQNSGIA